MAALEGKVAIVTGAGGGIGRAHAIRFAREGASVIVNDLGGARDGSGAEAGPAQRVVKEIREAGGQAESSCDNVGIPEGAQGIVDLALRSFGRLDVLVNNAGILRDRTLRKMTVEEFDSVIQVHVRGSFLCLQAAARAMIDAGHGGRIINTTSVSGLVGIFGQANYAAAKAGVYGLTRVAHLELFDKHKITVNALAPLALTRMTDDLPAFQAVSNAAELLSPDRIADVCAFLASEDAADISGCVVAVRGTQVWLYEMGETEPCTPLDGDAWSFKELRSRWSEIASRSRPSEPITRLV
ncbi:MAG: SDR family NAD(P)-dependent oxidoreductase [Proteobacteria bacterium]|nr:SDR family NAD(P)-dependent oxidoreductase [Pseudomonadota bacterium]